MRRFWQVASGDRGRDYSSLCLQNDIMCVGPGRYGPFDASAYATAAQRGGLSDNKLGMLRDFHDKVQPDDIVLLRNGHNVVGMGTVTGDYIHSETFDDVSGWDLQHVRRVLWQRHLDPELLRIQQTEELFGHMKQQPMFGRVGPKHGQVLERIQPLLDQFQSQELAELPADPPRPLSLEELGQQLFSKGIANEAVDRVLSAIARQRRLLAWYSEHASETERPNEHEVVAHMVLPLLLALGWSEQLIAVEWHKVDLAAFSETPTTAASCVLVCEAKGISHGLEDVLEQACRYAQSLKLDGCTRILVTQGGRFYVYDKPTDGWCKDLTPTGYFNVEKIRTNHLHPAGTNAVDTIVALSPIGVLRTNGRFSARR